MVGIFHCHVSFPGCKWLVTSVYKLGGGFKPGEMIQFDQLLVETTNYWVVRPFNSAIRKRSHPWCLTSGNAVTWTAAVGGSSEDWPRAVQMLRRMQQYHGVFPWGLFPIPNTTRWWVSNICYFHHYLGKISNLTTVIFFRWVETTNQTKCMVYLPTVPQSLTKRR